MLNELYKQIINHPECTPTLFLAVAIDCRNKDIQEELLYHPKCDVNTIQEICTKTFEPIIQNKILNHPIFLTAPNHIQWEILLTIAKRTKNENIIQQIKNHPECGEEITRHFSELVF